MRFLNVTIGFIQAYHLIHLRRKLQNQILLLLIFPRIASRRPSLLTEARQHDFGYYLITYYRIHEEVMVTSGVRKLAIFALFNMPPW